MSGTEVVIRESRRRYHWPEVQLNLWIFVVLAGAATVLGINAWFIVVQDQLKIGIPWLVQAQQANELDANQQQAVHLCHCDLFPYDPFPRPYSCPCGTTVPNTWRNLHRLVYTVRLMVNNTDRNIDTTVRIRKCQ